MALSSAAEKLESFRETQQMLDQPENLRTAFEQDGYLFLPGAPIEAIDDHPLYGLGTYQALAESRLMLDLARKVFGQPVFMYRSTNSRFALPDDEAYLTPPHRDY